MASSSSFIKASNPVHNSNKFDIFKDNYLPTYYEQDIYENQPLTFRSSNNNDEELFGYDNDIFYEETLLNSNFLNSIQKNNDYTLNRLNQILNHINPNNIPSQSQSSTTSTTTSSQLQELNVNNSIFTPDSKGKGKFKSTLQ